MDYIPATKISLKTHLYISYANFVHTKFIMDYIPVI